VDFETQMRVSDGRPDNTEQRQRKWKRNHDASTGIWKAGALYRHDGIVNWRQVAQNRSGWGRANREALILLG
jgi:hypothetical protein